MGIFGKIRDLFHGDKVEVETIERRSVKMDEQNSTLIFNGMPDYNSVIATDNQGGGIPISPRIINQMAADDAKNNNQLNQRFGLPQTGTPPRGRGVGVNSMSQQMPPMAPQYPPQQPQPQYGQLAPGYQPPVQQPMQPQPMPPQGMNIPIQGAAPAQQPLGFLEEPYSELLMTDEACHVIVDLPGIKKEDVDIKLTQDNEVAVTFTRSTFVSQMSAAPKKGTGKKKGKEKTKWVSQVNIPEFLLGKHTVVYKIIRPVDENNITCKFEYGQVHVILGFRTPLEGKSISIG